MEIDMANAIKKRTHFWIAATMVTVLAALAAGFLVGKSIAAREYQEGIEYNIRLNHSDLEGIGELEGTVYVTGHKDPDADTVGSSIAYASMLRQLGYDAQPVILGEINGETEYVLNAAGLEMPQLLDDASGFNMVLVDHGEYAHSADGLKNANILSIIDHHGAGSVTTGKPIVYDGRPLAALSRLWTGTGSTIRFCDGRLDPVEYRQPELLEHYFCRPGSTENTQCDRRHCRCRQLLSGYVQSLLRIR